MGAIGGRELLVLPVLIVVALVCSAFLEPRL
jgi:hypothetical protein